MNQYNLPLKRHNLQRMIEKIKVDEYLALAKSYPVLDVRSPGEFSHAHIPGAYSFPLFTDDERKIVGTLYKQEGKKQAIKTGLDYFGKNMRKMVEDAEQIVADHARKGHENEANIVLVHCWRGGMRSAGVAWLLDLYGFRVYSLAGGYKAFRNWVLQQFEKPYEFNILGGYTGSGKTEVIHALAQKKYPVIDLEGIAVHKGSAFGGLGNGAQPTQEMFENQLAIELNRLTPNDQTEAAIWVEDESQRIGLVNIPATLWKTLRTSPIFFLDIPFEERLNHITESYGQYPKEQLVNAIMRIQKRLGNLNAKNAINSLLENNYKESFRILLHYYDKYYMKGFNERKSLSDLQYIVASDIVDPQKNFIKITEYKEIIHGTTDTGN
jgi:tRNA 2-selenouridine synthase